MSRLHAAHPAAGRYDHEHGDPGYWPTAAEQSKIERLADRKLTERLYADPAAFADLMDGIDGGDYYQPLQRALANLDRACEGDLIALNASTAALSQIQAMTKREAERVWRDELRDEARTEVLGVEEA